jgi:protease-4
MNEVTIPTPSQDKKKSHWWVWLIVAVVIFLILSLFSIISLLLIISPSSSFGPFEGNKIGVVRIDGLISGDGGGDGLLGGESGTSPESFRKNIKDALDDKTVKAIVIRVNSPGGTPAASQEMYQELVSASKEKPVVASISDVGASGAYYAISPVKKIIADPASYVGSIGVYEEIPILKGLYKKLGISSTIIKAGKYKTIGHPSKDLTPAERNILQKQINEVYKQFIDDVAKGRKNLDEKEVTKLATGLAFPGSEAKRLGLIDETGDYSKAIKEAAKYAKIKKYEVVEFSNKSTIFNLGSLMKSFFNQELPREEITVR